MAVRSRLLGFATSLVAGTVTTIYTVPAGRTAIVRHLSLTNHAATAQIARLCVRSAGSVIDVRRDPSLPAGSTLGGSGLDIVAGPGDSIAVLLGAGGGAITAHVLACGSLLLGEPE